MSAAVESALLKKQWSLLTIRRSATIVAAIFQSAGILGFALVKTPGERSVLYNIEHHPGLDAIMISISIGHHLPS
jgi:hypothetical protein